MAHIAKPHVRETSGTTGLVTFVLAGAMRQSLRFAQVMAAGDTCDYCAMYDNTFEEGLGTLDGSGNLQRTTVSVALHADGTIDQNKVDFVAGAKTIVMTFKSDRVALLPSLITGALRFDIAQSLTAPQQAQARSNAPPYASGTKMLFRQSSSPVGWTKDVAHNDKALRVVSGSLVDGGSLDFSSCFGRTATDAFSILQGNLPSFTLPDTVGISDTRTWASTNSMHSTAGTPFGLPGGTILSLAGVQPVNVTGGSISKTGSVTSGGSGTPMQAGVDIRVKYVDVIFATKD